MKVIKQNVGIDVSKATLAVCFVMLYDDLSVKVKGSKTFTNNEVGFKELLSWSLLKRSLEIQLSFTMEPTGVYYENLAYFLHSKNEIIHVVLPIRAKRYAESLLGDSKTDLIDAKALGRMGLERKLDVWQIDTPIYKELKQLVSYAGLDVRIRESGAWHGRAKISKKGNVHIRKALYFPAYTNIKHSNNYLGLYGRIFEKKQKSLIAATAIQKKILSLIYTLWKNETLYVENYQQQRSLTERDMEISGNTEIMPSFCSLSE